MDRATEAKPATVSPEAAKQAGSIRARWVWAEPSVWTERMLTALENGVKGGKWFSLVDKVYSRENLLASWERVLDNGGSAGVDRITTSMFKKAEEANLERLVDELRAGTYRPQPIRRVWIPKPGGKDKRPLGIPTVRDRVVQGALGNVLEPIFERDFAEHSYGFRPGRGCKDALRRVDGLLARGYHWVVDADLKSYFDTIPHDRLMALVGQKVSDGRVLSLIEAYLSQEVMETAESWTPASGTPQGAVISPLLSNIYLDPLDRRMAALDVEMVRYADDFVLLCRSEDAARWALDQVRAWIDQAGLTLHPDKTRLVDARGSEGFDFLGYHFERGRKWPCKKSLGKFRDTIRHKTKRTNGQSLRVIIGDVNETLNGWFEYFKHSYKTTFPYLDGWIRMRLRSVLRKRHGMKGRGRGRDHQRWPNAYFAERGLVFLAKAHAQACQSSRR